MHLECHRPRDVLVRDRARPRDGPRETFRTVREILDRRGEDAAVGRQRHLDARIGVSCASGDRRGPERLRGMTGVVSQRQQRRVIDDDSSGEKPGASPGERGEGAPKPGRETHRGAARKRHFVDLSADRAEVAHEATDESYGAAVGRDARDRHLQLEARYAAAAAADVERIELRDPPVRIAIALRRGADEATTVRYPVVLVNVSFRRRYEAQLAAALRHDRDPLLVELDADLTAAGR